MYSIFVIVKTLIFIISSLYRVNLNSTKDSELLVNKFDKQKHQVNTIDTKQG